MAAPQPARRVTAQPYTLQAQHIRQFDFTMLPEQLQGNQTAQEGQEGNYFLMERQRAIEEIRTRIKCETYLEESKGGLYCCPFCDSGKKENSTGALKVYDTNTFTCHSCHKSGDVIDLFQKATGSDFNTAIDKLAAEIGITIDRKAETSSRPIQKQQAQPKPKQEEAAAKDFSTYYAQCLARLDDPAALAYLQGRGISRETALIYSIGYDPAADPANAPGGEGQTLYPTPRIIIPCSQHFYIGRATDPAAKLQKANPKGASQEPFNKDALYAQEVREVFITEGVFDALSLLEIGEEAVALNSAANADRLIKDLEKQRTEATLILCLDNDAAGKKAQETLRTGLQRLNIPFLSANISGSHKDPNAALVADRQAFTAAVKLAKENRPDNTSLYIDSFMAADMAKFQNDKKTGFSNLDIKAGGLYAGLYVLAAISSLGKTSLALQLADNLAESGEEVIYFSLEQSKLEMVTKSIARRTAQKDIAQAVTSLSIRKGYKGQQVQEAAAAYKAAVADRMNIVEGNFNCDLPFICNYIRQYIKRTGKRPVVFIDYLQILQPADDLKRQGTKEIVDNTVTELKRLSREQELTIFVISSVNRANYLQPIDFEALKESGGIEYTCDVVWGLQLQCLNEELFTKEGKIKEKRNRIKEEKAAEPRKIELVCLKNRYGIANYSCAFKFFPANDLFVEDTEAEDKDPEMPPSKWRNAKRI